MEKRLYSRKDESTPSLPAIESSSQTTQIRSLASRALALLAFLILGGDFPALAFDALVAFGDSYTDTGNAPSSPPNYWDGRFSNGPLWIEDLSPMLGFSYNSANNYAVSGTESDELGIAIAKFPGTSDSDNVLFAI